MEIVPESTSATVHVAWQALLAHRPAINETTIVDLFATDPNRLQRFSAAGAGLYLDYSKNRVTPDIFNHLIKLAEAAGLQQAIEDMFNGATINHTEGRQVLHTALRSADTTPLLVGSNDIRQDIHAAQDKIQEFVDKVHSGQWQGYSGKAITDIVSIGIGGSYLGPRVVVEALRPYWVNSLRSHFVSNVDGADLANVLESLNPETTLFIVQSKSFKTQETLTNALSAKGWYLRHGGDSEKIASHFVAVSSNVGLATEFGIEADNIFPMWDWVGGRYSLWSAIGLPIALQIGMPAFRELLKGAGDLDQHFRTTPFADNLPVIMGMLGIWYHNILGAHSHVILPYDQGLENLPAHLQQVDMESNGKSINREGLEVDYHTSPIIWGGAGTNGQHAYHQLLHQGTRWTPADFILPLRSHHQIGEHHAMLTSNCLAQSQALMCGKSLAQAKAELLQAGMTPAQAEELAPHKVIPGNRPSNTLLMDEVNPATLGALIALYEQKVFVQGVIWNLNSFDQWGVELGKQLSDSILPLLRDKGADTSRVDASTADLVARFRTAN